MVSGSPGSPPPRRRRSGPRRRRRSGRRRLCWRAAGSGPGPPSRRSPRRARGADPPAAEAQQGLPLAVALEALAVLGADRRVVDCCSSNAPMSGSVSPGAGRGSPRWSVVMEAMPSPSRAPGSWPRRAGPRSRSGHREHAARHAGPGDRRGGGEHRLGSDVLEIASDAAPNVAAEQVVAVAIGHRAIDVRVAARIVADHDAVRERPAPFGDGHHTELGAAVSVLSVNETSPTEWTPLMAVAPRLSATVLLVRVMGLMLPKMPPPKTPARLPVTALSRSTRSPLAAMPPPSPLPWRSWSRCCGAGSGWCRHR